MHRLNTAVFGTGFVGRVHLEGIRRLGYVHLYAIGEPQIEKARQLADEFQAEKTEADYHKILDDPAVDAVHVCTPNALHFPIAQDALQAGKHVICEKPLAISVEEARKLVALAKETKLRNCTFHNLRYYPMVQQMRRMREEGDLGEILVVQGTYSQDWLLYDTDWNWRIDSKANGPSRCMADIGSHWCDMAEHVTGQRITSLCADLQTFHKTRKRPKGPIETFAGKTLKPEDYVEVPIDTEDFGARDVPHGRPHARGLHGEPGIGGPQEPAEPRDLRQQVQRGLGPGTARRAVDREPQHEQPDPHQGPVADEAGGALLRRPAGRPQRRLRRHVQAGVPAVLPVDRRPGSPAEYPQFADGLRQLTILEAELKSNQSRAWVDVPAMQAASA